MLRDDVRYFMTQPMRRSDRVVDLTLVPVVLLATLALFLGFLPVTADVLLLLVVPSVALLVVAVVLVARARRRLTDVVDAVTE